MLAWQIDIPFEQDVNRVDGCCIRSDAPGPSSAAERSDPEGTAVAAIRESCLVPFLERQLVGASFTDMASRCVWC